MSFNIEKPKLKFPKIGIPKVLSDLSKNVTEGFKRGIEMVTRNGKGIFSWLSDAFNRLDVKDLAESLMSPLIGFITMVDDFGSKAKKVIEKGVLGESTDEEVEKESDEEEDVEKAEKRKYPFLDCKNFSECEALFIKRGYIKDSRTGNYFNPNRKNFEMRVLNEPVLNGTIGGQKVWLKVSALVRLKRADKAFFAYTLEKEGKGRHIQINSSGRTNMNQFSLYKKIKPSGGVVAMPGNSFHELFQAIDCQNWKEVEPFLLAEGFVGGIKNDRVHFSIGEMKYKKSPLLLSKALKKKQKNRKAS